MRPRRECDIWRMADGSWGAEVLRNGVGVGVRHVSLMRAVWHVLTVRRPDDWADFGVDAPSKKHSSQEEAA